MYILVYISDVLNPELYHKVSQIEIDLGGSDDEEMLNKSLIIQGGILRLVKNQQKGNNT